MGPVLSGAASAIGHGWDTQETYVVRLRHFVPCVTCIKELAGFFGEKAPQSKNERTAQ
jgi:hypothetical protein